jgi:hypothetical protein
MKCREFIDLLVDYCDGKLAGDQLSNFELHQQCCTCCEEYAATYRDTIRLGWAACHSTEEASSDDVPEQLVRRILDSRDDGRGL